jgi:hypothetical protein
MEYTLYKTETFIVDVVVESGKCLLEQREIMQFLELQGYLTLCGSGFEIDLINDIIENLDWNRIKKEIKDSSVCSSDDEELEEIEISDVETN